ncbi:MAG: molybdate ABC transporter substrate-binding protein [Pirellulaceae bacterium]
MNPEIPRPDLLFQRGPPTSSPNRSPAGAEANIFISASTDWVDLLELTNRVSKRRDICFNQLVLVVPTGNSAGIQNVDDLTRESVRRIALAGVNVPAGEYANQTLSKLQLLKLLNDHGKIVRAADVRAALVLAERGEVDAAFVYSTDARHSHLVSEVQVFDRSLHAPIVTTVALLRTDVDNRAAALFFEFLLNEEAQTVFESHGFDVVDSQRE